MTNTHVLITGGAGFIGSNAAMRHLTLGDKVTILDNFSRYGNEHNVAWLKTNPLALKNLDIVKADIRIDSPEITRAVKNATVIYHLAAQVAVTTSVTNPELDFSTNALGTFQLLEQVRLHNQNAIVLYSSTNKVYGSLEHAPPTEEPHRYSLSAYPLGVSEDQGLDFHSPYGCSKGCADQYVRDYARIYGIRTIVFRQSCIYGIRQFGMEDQGWIAWFSIAALANKMITLYGTGKQVRDVLWIDDLLDAYQLAVKNIQITKGQCYNIGGGPENTLSLIELLQLLRTELGITIPTTHGGIRPGDQPVYISDIRKAHRDFSFKPKVNPQSGLKKLLTWLKENRSLIGDKQ